MGYAYFFRVILEDVPDSVSTKELQDVYFPLFRTRYLELRTRDWFPDFEGADTTSSGGYGTGPNDHLLPEFASFTSTFPDFTFSLYLFHWDCMNINAYKIRGVSLLDQWSFSGEDMPTFNSETTMTFSFRDDDVYLKKDITSLLSMTSEEILRITGVRPVRTRERAEINLGQWEGKEGTSGSEVREKQEV